MLFVYFSLFITGLYPLFHHLRLVDEAFLVIVFGYFSFLLLLSLKRRAIDTLLYVAFCFLLYIFSTSLLSDFSKFNLVSAYQAIQWLQVPLAILVCNRVFLYSESHAVHGFIVKCYILLFVFYYGLNALFPVEFLSFIEMPFKYRFDSLRLNGMLVEISQSAYLIVFLLIAYFSVYHPSAMGVVLITSSAFISSRKVLVPVIIYSFRFVRRFGRIALSLHIIFVSVAAYYALEWDFLYLGRDVFNFFDYGSGYIRAWIASGAWTLAVENFPFGAGVATYGTYGSLLNESQTYDYLNFDMSRIFVDGRLVGVYDSSMFALLGELGFTGAGLYWLFLRSCLIQGVHRGVYNRRFANIMFLSLLFISFTDPILLSSVSQFLVFISVFAHRAWLYRQS